MPCSSSGGRGRCVAETERDGQIRLAAIAHVLDLHRRHGTIAWSQIAAGFSLQAEPVHLATKARGIFEPRQMEPLLSIKTVVPKPGGRV